MRVPEFTTKNVLQLYLVIHVLEKVRIFKDLWIYSNAHAHVQTD